MKTKNKAAIVAMLAGGCSTITVRNTGGGTVNVHQTRVVSTDASIPASWK